MSPRETREAHHTTKLIVEGVDILNEFEDTYKVKVLGGKETSPDELPNLKAHVVAFAMDNASDYYKKKITYKGVINAYLNSDTRHAISRLAQTSSQRMWPTSTG